MLDNLAGRIIGNYHLQQKIGAGGMGTVYRAIQLNLKREVAIKILPDDEGRNPEHTQRFKREAATIARLEHPHIVPLVDYGSTGGMTYLVMRYLAGGTLSQRLQRFGLPNATDIARILEQVGKALHYAHQQGVIHRDIKPANILFDNEANAYVSDFGIARVMGTTGNLTSTGTSLGTPIYMAPEQWKNENISGQTDVYALGVVLYVMLIGKPPFKADNPYTLMNMHIQNEPPPPSSLKPDLPVSLDVVIANALAKNPADRYSTPLHLFEGFKQAMAVTARQRGEVYMTQFLTGTMPSVEYTPVPRPQPSVSASHTQGKFSRQITITLPSMSSPTALLMAGFLMMAFLAIIFILAGAFLIFNDSSNNSETGHAGVPSPSPTHTSIPSDTPDIGATLNVRMTQTAAAWTATPTPNLDATLNVRMSQTAAAWTATPIPSPTRAPTLTQIPTWTPVQEPADMGTISYGSTVNGTIVSSAGHIWTFQGTSNDVITLTVNTSSFDAYIKLYNRHGELLTRAENPGNNAQLFNYTLPITGTYGIVIGSSDGHTGTYSFQLGRETTNPACAGNLAPRLTPGERAYVLTDPPLANLLRPAPAGTPATGRIEPGESFLVLDGFSCVDGQNWWYVETTDGERGWTSEGEDIYYVAPLD